MTRTAYSIHQSAIGIALEAVRGTAGATVQYWLPHKSPKYKPDRTIIADDTLQGSMVVTNDLVPGMRYDSHAWDGNLYPDAFPTFVEALLGSSDNKTAAATATTTTGTNSAGSTSLTVTASVPTGAICVVDSGALQETVVVKTGGTTTLTLLTPLVNSHASSATVTPLTNHKFSLLNNSGSGNQPPSCTITDYDGEEWRQLTASQLDKLTLKGNGTGLATYSSSWFANPSVTPSAGTPSYTSNTVKAPPGWTTALAIGGTYIPYVLDWEFDFGRGVKPIPALTGTQEYFLYFAGALTTSGKITVVEQSGAPELTEFLNGTNQTLDFVLTDLYSGGAIYLHSSKFQFKTGELDRSKDWVEAQLELELLPTSTDALAGGESPVTITVANSVTTSYAGV